MSSMFARCAVFVAAVLFAGAVEAAPITFYFTFSGASQKPANSTVITGYITFADLPANPPNINDLAGGMAAAGVVALDMTVSGAASGNGHFTIANFKGMYFFGGSGTLDYSSQLVGQAYFQDFNLFGTGSAPVGEEVQFICTNGGNGDCARLTSLIAGPAPGTAAVAAPAASSWLLGMLGLALAMVAGWTLRRD